MYAVTRDMDKLYKRHECPSKGRHLVATQKLEKDSLIFVERPLLSLQSLGNAHKGALVCRHCRAFVGGPDLCLAIACGRISRNGVWDYVKEKQKVKAEEEICFMVPCRNDCGEIFCSKDCEEEMWCCGGHELMCTGLIPEPLTQTNDESSEKSDDQLRDQLHPLLRFKLHAIQSNEIFLMVGDLVATVVSLRRQYIEKSEFEQNIYVNTTQMSNLEEILMPYLDFTLKPWWEVATEPSISDPTKLEEMIYLNKTLRELCSTSAKYLKEAFIAIADGIYLDEASLQNKRNQTFRSTLRKAIKECVHKYDIFSELFFGKIIGSFEQNAIGIRARHPLCRDIIENDSFRKRGHLDLIKCLEQTGMIGDAESDCDDLDDASSSQENIQEKTHENDKDCIGNDTNTKEQVFINHHVAEDDYTYDEIAEFIAGFQINEEGYGIASTNAEENKKDDDEYCCDEEIYDDSCDEEIHDSSDDLDMLFSPLDGTAMFYTTCKMNHSCNPNVIVRYAYSSSGGGHSARWGKSLPLVISCCALRGIKKGDELCISYIQSDMNYKKRQKALENYGFNCACVKCLEDGCLNENDTLSKQLGGTQIEDDEDLFGSEEEEEGDTEDGDVDISTVNPQSQHSGTLQLTERKKILNKAFSNSLLGSIPVTTMGITLSYVTQLGSLVLRHLDTSNNVESIAIKHCLTKTMTALKVRDYIESLSYAIIGEKEALCILQQHRSWPSEALRESHRCFAIVAAIGYAQNANFLPANKMLDKSVIFGQSRQIIQPFLDYVESHANSINNIFQRMSMNVIPDYRLSELQGLIVKEGLSSPIRFPITEVEGISEKDFHSIYFAKDKPVIIRGFAKSWSALDKWRSLNLFAQDHGNRIVPIEKGIMSDKRGMKEEMMTMKEFIRTFMSPSSRMPVWSLRSHESEDQNKIAYLAQHQLFDQIPSLLQDVEASPPICGKDGPTHVNTWIGTGGTRTPLHFDSYDNLLVQVVGAKYIRIYNPAETSKLHVLDKSDTEYGAQGNMSAVDCELENYTTHPMAKDAEYTEAVLFPGDCLYIPSRYWHYVRSMSTSISVNFWF